MNHQDDTVLYTIKEIMEARFKEVKEDLADIKIQTHKTNGRGAWIFHKRQSNVRH